MKKIHGIVLASLFLLSVRLTAQEVVSNAVLARTDGAVQAVAWSPDGSYFATSWNNSVILWDAALNTITAIWSGHKAPVISGKFSADGQWFLSVSEDNSVIIRNIDEKISAIKITGEGAYPIKDAVFMDNGYSVMTPVDGVSTTHCFRLVMTNQFIFKGIVSTMSPVSALDVNYLHNRLLITTADGSVTLFNLEENVEDSQKKQTFPRYAESRIGAVFSPDGNYYLSAADKTSLVISPVDGPGAFVIRDSDMPVNAAIYHPDGTKVAAALRNGMVKVYNVSDGMVAEAYSILVEAGDMVESLAFSPDGESLIAGTRLGYIFRWGASPEARREQVPIHKTYEMPDLRKLAEVMTDKTVVRNIRTEEEEFAYKISKKTVVLPENFLDIALSYNTLGSDYYWGALGLGGAYRTYQLYPMYVGGGAELTAGIPGGNFPNEYRLSTGESLSNPWVYSAGVFGIFGLCYYNVDKALILFSEMRAGVNLRFFFNNNFTYYYVSTPSAGFQFDLLVGAQWNQMRGSIGGQYDSNLGMVFKASVGFVFPIGNKKNETTEIPAF